MKFKYNFFNSFPLPIAGKSWNQYPAFFYGFSALVGASFALGYISSILLITFLTLLLGPFSHFCHMKLRIFLIIGICFASFYMAKKSYQFPEETDLGIEGIAEVELTSVSLKTTWFGEMWVYKAVLYKFESANGVVVAKNIPIRLSLSVDKTQNRPLAIFAYRLLGKLKKDTSGNYYSLSPSKNITWVPFKTLWNLAEWRYHKKLAVHAFIDQSIENKHVSSFLGGIATGEFDDMLLSSELGRFGLQHLMAISGLHFSIIAGLIGIGLSLFISGRIIAIGLVFLLTAYFLFLGLSPSVFRAWLTLVIAFLGTLCGKRSGALNSLGVAILIVSLVDPLLIKHIGFQFSFAVTAAILIGFSPVDRFLMNWLNKRTLSQVVDFDWLDQHAYCLVCFLRQSLALSIAVNIVAFPLTLYHFEKFPLMGLVYNLFFPFLMSLSLLLLLLACLTGFLPWISHQIHLVNEKYTQFLLNFTFNFPAIFDYNIYWPNLPKELLIIYLTIVFILGSYLTHLSQKEEMNNQLF